MIYGSILTNHSNISISLFSKIEGDENTIMGLPIEKIKEYLSKLK